MPTVEQLTATYVGQCTCGSEASSITLYDAKQTAQRHLRTNCGSKQVTITRFISNKLDANFGKKAIKR